MYLPVGAFGSYICARTHAIEIAGTPNEFFAGMLPCGVPSQ